MSSAATSLTAGVSPAERLEVLFEELSELTGQRNAIDGRIVDIVAEIDRGNLAGITGARSIPALIAWKTGTAPRNAETIATVAHRLAEFPRCAEGLRKGRYSLDQIGVIAERAADGSDEHYAQLAESATVSQLRTAIKLEPRPEPDPRPEPPRSITKTVDDESTTWRIKLPHAEADVRHRPAVPPRRADRAVEARPRRRQRRWLWRWRIRPVTAAAGHRRGVHESGRGRLG